MYALRNFAVILQLIALLIIVIITTFMFGTFNRTKYTVSKKQPKLFSSELRQISTNFDNVWQKDGQDDEIM